jgi:hypothetical protein
MIDEKALETESKAIRYVVVRTFHLSVLEKTLKNGDLVEMDGKSTLRINGVVPAEATSEDALNEAFRVLSKVAAGNQGILKEVPDVDRISKSQTITAFPIVGCLAAAEDWLGRRLEWDAANDDQREFLELFFEKGMDGIPKLGDQLRRMAAPDIARVNAWLKENGFDIELTSDPGPGGFAVASILDVLVEWLEKGVRRKITNESGTFDAVHLKQGHGVTILQNPHVHPNPVAKIATKSGDVIYMTPADELPDGRFGMESKIRAITVGVTHPDHRYEGVTFPMVSYDQQIDISFLRGMRTKGLPWFVEEAVQQTKFRMNEDGARVESAVSMSLKLSMPPPPFVIDRPFMLWITRDGVDMPLFGGLFAEDSWSDPGTLE